MLAEPALFEDPEPDNAAKWTERELLDRLRARYSRPDRGNGPEWVYMEHVRDKTGWANRTIDALALHLWESRNNEVHAFEVKVSRSDFRRELADPSKAETWTAWCEHFWIVAPAGVLRPEDMPKSWGLLVTSGTGLRIAKRSPRLRPKPPGYMPAEPLPRSLVACMLRSVKRQSIVLGKDPS